MDGVEISEAARILGISEAAVRKRIQRGTIKSYKVDGRLYAVLSPEDYAQNRDETVYKDAGDTQDGHYEDIVQAYQELIEAQKEEIAFLRKELSDRTEELRIKDHLLASRDETVRELLKRLELPERTDTSQQDTIKQEITALRESQASIEERLEERDRMLMETLRSMQEQATASEKKRGWWPFGRKK